MTDHTLPIYNNEEAARKHLENIRWPNGPICPKCGSVSKDHYEIKPQTEQVAAPGKRKTVARPGLWKCRDCRQQFSVTVNTVFEKSKIPLHKWLYATHLFTSSKKGVSAHQIHRSLGVTYKTAWFMMHRIREAARPLEGAPVMGGFDKEVEIDETYIGKKKDVKKVRGPAHKHAVLSLVERGGKVHSTHVTGDMFDAVKTALQNVHEGTTLMTDEAKMYKGVGKRFEAHLAVNHGVHEYVRGRAHTNTIESYFSIFKRGMTGIYQHCSEDHLHRYLFEFDFRYNNRIALGIDDATRRDNLLDGVSHKRLTYRRPDHH